MNYHRLHCILMTGFVSFIGISISMLAQAQPSTLEDDLAQCVKIETILERITCYDAVAGRDELVATEEAVNEVVAEPLERAIVNTTSTPVQISSAIEPVLAEAILVETTLVNSQTSNNLEDQAADLETQIANSPDRVNGEYMATVSDLRFQA